MAPLIFASTRRYLFHINGTHPARRKALGEPILRTPLVTVDIRSRTICSRVGEWDWGGAVCGARDGPWCRVGQRRIARCLVAPVGQRRTQMWLLSSRSARRVTTAARASRSRPGACASILLHQRQPWTCVRRDPDRWGASHRPGGVGPRRGLPALALASARGSSPRPVRARIAGSLLVRQEVHDEVVATVGAVGRSGFLRTGNGRRFRSAGYPCGGEL